jgi:hypothetical protein
MQPKSTLEPFPLFHRRNRSKISIFSNWPREPHEKAGRGMTVWAT